MALTVRNVAVRDFRSYECFDLELDPCLTVLVGPNAVGKTNLIEAVQLLTEAESFRKPSWVETVREGAEEARLSLVAEGEGRRFDVALAITRRGRRYSVNGKARRSVNQVAGVIPCVVFTPDDLRMVKDSAEKRRGALDALGSQLSPKYGTLRAEYDRVLKHRNVLLRDVAVSEQSIEPWTEQLIAYGASLVSQRMKLFSRVDHLLCEIYSSLAEEGGLQVRYVTSWERDGLEETTLADTASSMKRHLEMRRQAERARGTTMSGPHRDDVVFEINGRDARKFASQGQQRTIALAWKLAEVAVITEIAAQRPVLLLDDVMSELDEKRRHALASFVGSAAQTVVTTTNLGYFDESLIRRAKVVELR